MSLICDRSVVFSGYSGFSTNNTDRHDITEILLKVALNFPNVIYLSKCAVFYEQKVHPVMVINNPTDIKKTNDHLSPQITKQKTDDDRWRRKAMFICEGNWCQSPTCSKSSTCLVTWCCIRHPIGGRNRNLRLKSLTYRVHMDTDWSETLRSEQKQILTA